MARPKSKTGTAQGVAAWKSLLAQVLRDAPTRPTTPQIAGAVTAIRESMGGRAVSAALVEKWRSAASPIIPLDDQVATALVDALVDLGVFPPQKASLTSQEQLLSLLGFRRVSTLGRLLHTVYRTCQDRLLELVKQVEARGGPPLDDSEKVMSFACLASQYLVFQEAGRLKKGDHVVALMPWPTGDQPDAADARNATIAELTGSIERVGSAKDQEPFFSTLRAQGVDVHIVLNEIDAPSAGIRSREARTSDRSDQVSSKETTIRDLAAGQLLALAKKLTSHSVRAWRRPEQPSPDGNDLWIHLLPKGRCQAWRMVRHPGLFRKIQSSSASTFCAPLDDHDALKRLRAQIGLIWDEGSASWAIHPGDRAHGGSHK